MKKIIGTVAILLMITGWVLSTAERFDFVYKLFAAEYRKAKSALTQMEKTHYLLEEGTEGFNEISGVAGEFIKAGPDLKISAIRTLGWDNTQGPRNIAIEIYFATRPPLISVIHNIDQLIEARYYKKDLFVWSAACFWAGALIILLALFIKER